MEERLKSISWFYQNDSQWKDEPLGEQTEETIGSWGGLLTAMTVVVNQAGYEETPQSLNKKIVANNGYIGALALPAILQILFPCIKYRGFYDCSDYAAPLERIDSALEAGHMVLVQVDWNPKAGINTHWVLLVERQGNDFLIFDPYRYKGDKPGSLVLLTERYNYRGEDSNQSITAVIWYEIVRFTEHDDATEQHEIADSGEDISMKQTAEESKIEDEKIILLPTVDGLTFRREPKIQVDNQIRKLKIDDQLIPDESLTEVIEKVGVQGYWIRVRDRDGIEGYVAAWYVRLQSNVSSN